MRFQVIPLVDVCNVNDFSYGTDVQSVVGDAVDLYFQLSDGGKNLTQYGWYPGGLRYIPPALSTLQVTFKNIDDSKVVNRFATQPFPEDASIWKVSVLATDPIAGTVNLKFVLSEPNGLSTITRTTAIKAAFGRGVAQ